MSVWPKERYEVPVTTVRVAKAAFPKGCLTIRIRDELGELFADKDFAQLYSVRGRPGFSPAQLALVSVLQFVEGLTDRQAADAVRGRLDWKYALGLELSDSGFDASVLTEFRVRLIADGETERLLSLMLDRLRERGLLSKGGRQRTDSTHVVSAVRDLHRLEQVIETVRAVLEVLAVVAPAWLAAWIPDEWYVRYGQRGDDWRLPKSMQARVDLGVQVGYDGFQLLQAIYAAADQPWLAGLDAAEILRMTWVQQYWHDSTGSICWRDKDCGLPPGIRMILSPYDIDARVGIKRGRNWRGYKAHFTETCEPEQPHFVVHVATTDGATSDVDTVEDRHDDLAAADLLPEQHLADTGYISAGQIVTARDKHRVEVIGPLLPDISWQAADPDAFDLTNSASTGMPSMSSAQRKGQPQLAARVEPRRAAGHDSDLPPA